MGAFSFNGIDTLEISLKQVANLSGEVKESIIMAGAKVLKEHMGRYLTEHHFRTGDLADAIQAKYYGDGTAVVAPYGNSKKKGRRTVAQAHKGSGAMKRKKHHGATSTSSMMEVGYLLEFGTPRMKPRHWMETSNEQATPDFDKATVNAWEEHLKQSGF